MLKVTKAFMFTIKPSSHSRVQTEVQRTENDLTILEIGLLRRSIRSDLEGLSSDDLALGASSEMY
jgi:hypothetical protein